MPSPPSSSRTDERVAYQDEHICLPPLEEFCLSEPAQRQMKTSRAPRCLPQMDLPAVRETDCGYSCQELAHLPWLGPCTALAYGV
jgi:hypothetical protein